jgi:putative transposase
MTHRRPVDLLDRNFSRDAPNQRWVTEMTEHSTREGKVSCAVVLEVPSRRVVGWSIDPSQAAAVATNAWQWRSPTGHRHRLER